MDKMMNRFNVQGQVQQDSDGEFVRFSDVEEMCKAANSFLENLLIEASEKSLPNEKVAETMRGFFRMSFADY
jgi:hypothetical protein